jgi:hypothetical protein
VSHLALLRAVVAGRAVTPVRREQYPEGQRGAEAYRQALQIILAAGRLVHDASRLDKASEACENARAGAEERGAGPD